MSAELLAKCLHLFYVQRAVAVIVVLMITITIITMSEAPLQPAHSNGERDSGAGYSTETRKPVVCCRPAALLGSPTSLGNLRNI